MPPPKGEVPSGGEAEGAADGLPSIAAPSVSFADSSPKWGAKRSTSSTSPCNTGKIAVY